MPRVIKPLVPSSAPKAQVPKGVGGVAAYLLGIGTVIGFQMFCEWKKEVNIDENMKRQRMYDLEHATRELKAQNDKQQEELEKLIKINKTKTVRLKALP